MSKYVDIYLLPIPDNNVEDYRKMAEAAGKLFRKHGALTYREYVASDLKVPDGIMSFPTALDIKDGETLIYAAVEFESEEHGNESMAKIMADPELGAGMEDMSGDDPMFDMKRMIYGGFRVLVNV
ncbi:MAG: DUF1428 domain-containing protein [Saprospiraceae bacterium]|nr:DUF1428 domain-containing protein [Pyrinomonadaceae bacterium]